MKVKKEDVEDDDVEGDSSTVSLKKEEKEYLSIIEQIHPSILDTWYTAVINVRKDGFCGFRALAVQLFGDENEFWKVKKQMRDFLLMMDEEKD